MKSGAGGQWLQLYSSGAGSSSTQRNVHLKVLHGMFRGGEAYRESLSLFSNVVGHCGRACHKP